MYYLYILYSSTANLYYVGHTDNYLRRLSEHNQSDRTTFTSKHRPWKLMAVFECGSERSEAMKIERYIKKQKSRRFIEGLIEDRMRPEALKALVKIAIEK